MAASYRIRRSGFLSTHSKVFFLNVFSVSLCVLSKMSLDSIFSYWRHGFAYCILDSVRRRTGNGLRLGRALLGIPNAPGPLAVFTVGMAVAVSDWLCSIIPNPTVLTVLGLKIVLIAAALLHLPSAPSFDVLSALGGMAFCFLVFSAPSLMGKRIGAGDIKLAAAMGFLLGFGDSLLAIFFMGLLMLAYCVFQRKMPLLAFLKSNITMGPFIAAGMMIACALPYLPL